MPAADQYPMTSQVKPRILAVDDSRVMRRAIAKILGKDYEVLEAEHGNDAWGIIEKDHAIQLVFTDLSMPYLDGYGLLERIRQSAAKHIRDLPVIIITGEEDDDKAQQKALNKGATDFISKPFQSIQLKARAKAHIQFEQTARKLSEAAEKLEQHATVDVITGLGGRHYFDKVAAETLAYTKRHGGNLILLRMDIDNFENLFLQHGKASANVILKDIGALLGTLVRDEDKIARIGLAKFALLLIATNLHDARLLAERMRNEILHKTFTTNHGPINVTVSISILEPQLEQDTDIKSLMAVNESALLELVARGGNGIVSKSTVVDVLGMSGLYNIDVATAIRLIKEGRGERVRPHTATLLRELRPLLELLRKETTTIED